MIYPCGNIQCASCRGAVFGLFDIIDYLALYNNVYLGITVVVISRKILSFLHTTCINKAPRRFVGKLHV